MKMTLKDTAVETTETMEYRKIFVPSCVCNQAQRRSRDSGIGANSSGRISGLRSGLVDPGPDSPPESGAQQHGVVSESLDFLVPLLDIEPIEMNLFRGMQPVEERQRVFGGQ